MDKHNDSVLENDIQYIKQILMEIKESLRIQNGRVRRLEGWRSGVVSAVGVLTALFFKERL